MHILELFRIRSCPKKKYQNAADLPISTPRPIFPSLAAHGFVILFQMELYVWRYFTFIINTYCQKYSNHRIIYSCDERHMGNYILLIIVIQHIISHSLLCEQHISAHFSIIKRNGYLKTIEDTILISLGVHVLIK